MKNKEQLLLTLAAIQPFLWWMIFNIFYQWAKENDTQTGLGFSCFACSFIMLFAIIIPIVNKYLNS